MPADFSRVTIKTDTVLQKRRLLPEIHADGIGILLFFEKYVYYVSSF